MVPLYCGGSSLWVGLDDWLVKVSWLGKLESVLMGGVGRVVCQGFLVREACVGVLVGGAGSLLSGVQ